MDEWTNFYLYQSLNISFLDNMKAEGRFIIVLPLLLILSYSGCVDYDGNVEEKEMNEKIADLKSESIE